MFLCPKAATLVLLKQYTQIIFALVRSPPLIVCTSFLILLCLLRIASLSPSLQGQMLQMTVQAPPSLNRDLEYLNKDERLLRWMVRKADRRAGWRPGGRGELRREGPGGGLVG